MDENFARNDELLEKKNGSNLSKPTQSPLPFSSPTSPSFRHLRRRPMVRIEKNRFHE